MPVYQYEAMDDGGIEIKDSIGAESEVEAQQLIREKGFYVTKIREKERKKKSKASGNKGGENKKAFTIGGVKAKKLCTFTRSLSTLQDAGLPLLRSLRILEGQEKPGALKNCLMDVIEDVESGNTLSEAMAKQPKAFDNLYVNMVKAGEIGGAAALQACNGARLHGRELVTTSSATTLKLHLGISDRERAVYSGVKDRLPQGYTIGICPLPPPLPSVLAHSCPLLIAPHSLRPPHPCAQTRSHR